MIGWRPRAPGPIHWIGWALRVALIAALGYTYGVNHYVVVFALWEVVDLVELIKWWNHAKMEIESQ